MCAWYSENEVILAKIHFFSGNASISKREINEITLKPIGGYANPELVSTNNQNLGVSKQPELDHRSTAIKVDEARYAEEAIKWVENGASIIAGCCGTGPSHIKKLREVLKN